MKTVTCDVCGRTREDLLYRGAHMFHFKRQEWWFRQEPGVLSECDICEMCLQEIKERMRKKEGE